MGPLKLYISSSLSWSDGSTLGLSLRSSDHVVGRPLTLLRTGQSRLLTMMSRHPVSDVVSNLSRENIRHSLRVYRVFKNTEFYGGGKTSENSLNEPAELSLRCLAKTENDHVCRALRHWRQGCWYCCCR